MDLKTHDKHNKLKLIKLRNRCFGYNLELFKLSAATF